MHRASVIKARVVVPAEGSGLGMCRRLDPSQSVKSILKTSAADPDTVSPRSDRLGSAVSRPIPSSNGRDGESSLISLWLRASFNTMSKVDD